MSANYPATATFTQLRVVPKLEGTRLRAARSAITKAHCSVGKITKPARRRSGRPVIVQRLGPGKRVAAG